MRTLEHPAPGRSTVAPAGVRGWALAALDLVFPALCPVCAAHLGPGRRDPLCGPCWDAIDRLAPPWCSRCGLPSAVAEAGPCRACARVPPPYDYARAGGRYRGPLRDALLALKFRGMRALARPLADLVLPQCVGAAAGEVDALVPVPLARARERERGFNQAQLVADRLGRALVIPVRAGWLARTRNTEAQTDLSARARQVNVEGAFRASPSVSGRRVLLVDDVLTTGATVEECARTLRAAGAATVGVVTVARVI